MSNEPYVYDEKNDRYIFALRSHAKAGRPFVVPGGVIKSTVLAYSNSGSAATINEIARTNGWHRTTVVEVLRALGKTHDSAPFTDEDLGSRPEDDLVEDSVRLKEESVLRKAERRDWKEKAKLADEAKHFDRFVAGRMLEVIREVEAKRGSISVFTAPAPKGKPPIGVSGKVSVIYGLTDIHLGAKAWKDEVGAETTREIVRARVLATTQKLIHRVLHACRGCVIEWVVPVGSDNIHADTDSGTTTKGTPLDTDGSFARMFLEACELYEEVISLLARSGKIQLVAMPGNHDRVSTMMLNHWLSARYRNNKNVKTTFSAGHRNYFLRGKSLIGMVHGDSIKDNKIPLIMASEASELWGKSKHRVVFSGHTHTDTVGEFAGVRVIHMPSLATADRWHHRSGYVGNTKALAAHIIDHKEGLVCSMPVPSDV